MNRLAEERSPYLRQHADNPVDWYPWGEEAFRAARERDVPVLLSIGYASCHWCHVMAHESFEDPQTARFLNERFVNVKVDREERPDVDAIYMAALQALQGQGGWPLTAWLDPEGRPLYAGTYFPAQDRQGMPSFRRVAEALHQAWRDRREALGEDAGRLTQYLEQVMAVPSAGDGPRGEALHDAALDALEQRFDAENGGYGRAPKFPPHGPLRFLHALGGPRAAAQSRPTLRALARGGIYDQLGGGFARYAVDAKWRVPHFEKMLTDNAQLLPRFAEAHRETGDREFRDAALGIVDWLEREMRLPGGAFASALDADAEGEEGRFYVWTREAFDEAAGDDAPLARAAFGVGQVGELEGKHVLRKARTEAELAEAFALSEEELRGRLEAVRARLFAERERRVRPERDDKVLAGPNGLAVGGLARAARLLREPRALRLAREAARFVLGEMRTEGRLWRRWHGGEVAVPGLLEDHAQLGLGLLELHRADADPAWLDVAAELAEEIERRFEDPDGGFRSTPHDGEALLVRPRSLVDGAVPSDNVAAAELVWRVGRLRGRPEAERRAQAAVAPLSAAAARQPDGFGHVLALLTWLDTVPREAAVVSPAGGDALWPELAARPLDAWVVQHGRADAPEAERADWPLLRERGLVDGRAAAYLCERYACRRPITDPAELRAALEAAGPA